MKRVHPAATWPESWRRSFEYDRLEIYGEAHHRGYAYSYRVRRRHALELVRKAVRPPARVLDVAAAQGNFSLTLADEGYQVTWNDLRDELAGYVRLKDGQDRLRFAPGDVLTLGFPEPFDAVLATEVIEHVAHPDRFLRRLASLVPPGGHIVLTTPNGGYFRNRLPRFSDCADPSAFEAHQFRPDADGHIFLLEDDELHELARGAGLRVRDVRLFATPLTCGHLRSERLLRWLPARAVLGVERLAGTLPWSWRRRVCVGLAAWLERPAHSAGAS